MTFFLTVSFFRFSTKKPVYFSTDQVTGKVVRGLSRIPSPEKSNRPLVVVGNHQLFGLDMWMMVPHLYQERCIPLRGLAHPVVFDYESIDDDIDGRSLHSGSITMNSAVKDTYRIFRAFGALPATPASFYKLLETNQCILHYPGGAREAYHSVGEDYLLFWPGDDKAEERCIDGIASSSNDFVRMAARFNATIVPLSAIGADGSVQFSLSGNAHEYEQVLSVFRRFLPKLSEVLQSIIDSPLTARGGKEDKSGPRPPPLVLPKLLPARHYFLFGRPYNTEHLDHNNRQECARVYGLIRLRVERGIEQLRRASKKDPFLDSFKRIIFELTCRKKAPTFSVYEFDELTKS